MLKLGGASLSHRRAAAVLRRVGRGGYVEQLASERLSTRDRRSFRPDDHRFDRGRVAKGIGYSKGFRRLAIGRPTIVRWCERVAGS
jgi:hypothetical protein